ncbi:MAG: alpha/beta hydrolase [Alphaproteobacteria bacterium]|nr:alpha/beta hydrolase [Alphaproteobacteria bacterium]
MLNLNKSTSVEKPEAAILGAAIEERLIENSTLQNDISKVTAREWFALGNRVPYDRRAKKILRPGDTLDSPDVVHVFRRIAKDATPDKDAVWTSFLPGWPDGSFGWAKVDQHLSGKTVGPKLFVDYVGHGDSDKPGDYPYGTMERADLVEAQWEAEGIRSTFIVSFDYSSIVALELLSRQQDRRDRGADPTTRIEGVLLINGGLFVDAHTHPWFTTPVLKSPIGGLVTSLAQRSKFAFGELMKPLWSKDYDVTSEEINELYDAIGRRNGVVALSKSAGFVDQHKRNSERWNLGRIFHASGDAVSFHIVGSEDDPFEGRQAVAARERLGDYGLDVRILPGGHLTTSEHPDLLAQIIHEVGPQR